MLFTHATLHRARKELKHLLGVALIVDLNFNIVISVLLAIIISVVRMRSKESITSPKTAEVTTVPSGSLDPPGSCR